MKLAWAAAVPTERRAVFTPQLASLCSPVKTGRWLSQETVLGCHESVDCASLPKVNSLAAEPIQAHVETHARGVLAIHHCPANERSLAGFMYRSLSESVGPKQYPSLPFLLHKAATSSCSVRFKILYLILRTACLFYLLLCRFFHPTYCLSSL